MYQDIWLAHFKVQLSAGNVRRICNSINGRPVWGDVSFFNCRSPVVINLVDEISRLVQGFQSKNISDILEETKRISEVDDLYARDIQDIVQEVLENTKHRTKTQKDRQQFIRSSSNIVSQKRKNVWMTISFRNNLAKQVISGTDLNARNYISGNAEIGKIVSYSTPNIEVLGILLRGILQAKDISLLDTDGEGVIIPGLVTNELQQATVVKYSSIKDILSDEDLKKSVDNTIGSTESLTIRSTIVSFITKPGFNESVSKPFKIILQNNQPEINNSIWSSEGCTLNEAESSEKNVICDCDHNTAFAIMMDVADVQPTETERKILETISTIGCSISLVGITLTFLLHVCFWKHFKSPRVKVLLSLCIAIGFTDLFAILEGVARDSPVSFFPPKRFYYEILVA
ncbi:brain-specific angiogenesis inhibitor 1-like [Paramuricea clavata]|uniref:Brain-specific angiogenesis inhibitor 1-like n=1 Tax=Paramuricea clavata TaxID=317549 RepID=A0A7D9EHI0_PARCT|nr:brain-specific angiogenesis inhibitor 1-like [Paramuricea clavata]